MPAETDNAVLQFAAEQHTVVKNEKNEVDKLESLLSRLTLCNLEYLGYALTNLKITSHEQSGQYGIILTLEMPTPGELLPRSTLRSGTEVGIVGARNAEECARDDIAKSYAKGVVKKVTARLVLVAVQKVSKMAASDVYSIQLLANDANCQRMFEALKKLSMPNQMRPNLHHALFGDAAPTFNPSAAISKRYFDNSLNDEQRQAVNLALTANDIALIHGPPGTGKTHTLVEIIRQLAGKHQKLLVCGPSNTSVDNIAERLIRVGFKTFKRLGNPVRMKPSVLKFNTDSKEAAFFQPTTYGPEVILATLCTAGGSRIAKMKTKFDVVIIDESAQAVEAECWIAAIQAPKLILAGDHHQLPPTLISPQNQSIKCAAGSAAAGNNEVLTKTMFKRVSEKFGDSVCQMLTTQYRMHSKIMQVSNEHLYDGRLIAHDSVASHLLHHLPGVEETPSTLVPLVFVDTAKAEKRETAEKPNTPKNAKPGSLDMSVAPPKSWVNRGEAKLAVKHAKALIAAGVKAKDVVIVTPYNGQVRMLKMLSKQIPGVEIGSVDGFQGSEKEAVILSMVRSNKRMEVGFLDDYRRINVAITRARRHLCVIGDSQTIRGGGEFLQSLLEHLLISAD
ncbi:hypothetical protein H4R23_004755, partial [Coemansia sp. Cherry 401B]